MTRYRQYVPEELQGEKINHRSRPELRKYYGRLVEFNRRGFLSKSCGVLEDAVGNNILIDGNWEWGPSISSMHVLPEVKP